MPEEVSRSKALELLHEWTKGESLRKHALAVSVCTESCRRREAEAPPISPASLQMPSSTSTPAPVSFTTWTTNAIPPSKNIPSSARRITPRIHCWPDLRPQRHPRPRRLLRSPSQHASRASPLRLRRTRWIPHRLRPRQTLPLHRPKSKSQESKKKMKDKAFARAVKREDITAGDELLNLPSENHLANCLAAMQSQRHRTRPRSNLVILSDAQSARSKDPLPLPCCLCRCRCLLSPLLPLPLPLPLPFAVAFAFALCPLPPWWEKRRA